MEQRRGLLADEVNAARVVNVVDIVPADALCPVFLLHRNKQRAWHHLRLSCAESFTFLSADPMPAICLKTNQLKQEIKE